MVTAIANKLINSCVVEVVAVKGNVNDWAAYRSNEYTGVGDPNLIAFSGTKLKYEIAKELFPELDRSLTWRK